MRSVPTSSRLAAVAASAASAAQKQFVPHEERLGRSLLTLRFQQRAQRARRAARHAQVAQAVVLEKAGTGLSAATTTQALSSQRREATAACCAEYTVQRRRERGVQTLRRRRLPRKVRHGGSVHAVSWTPGSTLRCRGGPRQCLPRMEGGKELQTMRTTFELALSPVRCSTACSCAQLRRGWTRGGGAARGALRARCASPSRQVSSSPSAGPPFVSCMAAPSCAARAYISLQHATAASRDALRRRADAAPACHRRQHRGAADLLAQRR